VASPLVALEPLDYNRDIRPILSENCFYCHGQDANKRQADLRLDVRYAAVESGAISPGQLASSSLWERITTTDEDLSMPPVDSNRRLTEAQRQLLARWIEQGATYAQHWAFQPPQRIPLPSIERVDWPRNAIDYFVLQKLEQAGLSPAIEADRATLIRRLYADLIGLPPTPAAVDAFVADSHPLAYERLVDRLLASPRYGERMALPWLDAARYADSNGFQQDGDTWQWMWRDWLVNALNADMPFDQFSIEQLAGDLLPQATIEQRIATGFNRNHLLNGEGGAIAEEQRFNNLFDRVDTTSTTWLGLTMACAQCHDHKYDPLTMTDYYRLLDTFNRVPETGRPTRYSSRIRVSPPVVELPTAENSAQLARLEAQVRELQESAQPVIDGMYAAWKLGIYADGEPADTAELPRGLTPLLRKPDNERTAADKKSIQSQLRKFFEDTVQGGLIKDLPQVKRFDAAKRELEEYRGDQIPRAMVMSDEQPRETRVLDRGDYLSPVGEPVVFAPPSFLPSLPPDAPRNRLGFAQWLFLPENPLTARVQVNRMWQYFHGIGIVKTTEDLGVQSEHPLHLDLLNWLAVEFRESGWSQKRMHRLIVTSATYRQTSKISAEQLSRDPENRLHGRASRFRLPSMVLRDSALAASDLLVSHLGGQPVYPYQPDAIWEALAITKERDFTYPASHGGDLYRRSLYTFWRRTVSPANMFDTANRQTCTVRASQTSTPLHALTTLNDPTWVEAARVLAESAILASVDLPEQLTFAFRRVLGRVPTPSELAALSRTFHKQQQIYRADEPAALQLLAVGEIKRDDQVEPIHHAAMTSVALAILNLDEALSRE
jgi:hypothetical protein